MNGREEAEVMESEPMVFDASSKDDDKDEEEGRSGRSKRRIRKPKKFQDFIPYR